MDGHHSLRAVTIAKAHERPYGAAKRNFSQNPKHFIERVDFVQIPESEFAEIL
jgi:hypothetical protein